MLALDAILAGRTPTTPFERLFRAVEDLCRKGDAGRVYRALKGPPPERLGIERCSLSYRVQVP